MTTDTVYLRCFYPKINSSQIYLNKPQRTFTLTSMHLCRGNTNKKQHAYTLKKFFWKVWQERRNRLQVDFLCHQTILQLNTSSPHLQRLISPATNCFFGFLGTTRASEPYRNAFTLVQFDPDQDYLFSSEQIWSVWVRRRFHTCNFDSDQTEKSESPNKQSALFEEKVLYRTLKGSNSAMCLEPLKDSIQNSF